MGRRELNTPNFAWVNCVCIITMLCWGGVSCSRWAVTTTFPMPRGPAKFIHHSQGCTYLKSAFLFSFSSPMSPVKSVASFAVFWEVRIVASRGSLERLKSRVSVSLTFMGSAMLGFHGLWSMGTSKASTYMAKLCRNGKTFLGSWMWMFMKDISVSAKTTSSCSSFLYLDADISYWS